MIISVLKAIPRAFLQELQCFQLLRPLRQMFLRGRQSGRVDRDDVREGHADVGGSAGRLGEAVSWAGVGDRTK